MIEKLERIASVRLVPGCITSVVVVARPELAASVVHAVGHKACPQSIAPLRRSRGSVVAPLLSEHVGVAHVVRASVEREGVPPEGLPAQIPFCELP